MTVVKKHDLDHVLKEFSIFGRYHVKATVLLMFANLISSLDCLNFIFVAEATGYRCLDRRFWNDSCASLRNSTEVCAKWVYDDPHSFVAEFNLACQEWKRTLIGTSNMIGYMVGLLFVGPISDRFGRKTAIVTYAVVQGIIGVASSYVTSYWGYVVIQFIKTMFNFCSPVFILGIEIVTHEKRVLYSFFGSMGFSMGFAVLALIAWLFPYWRHLLKVIYLLSFLIFFYWFLLDESPRWLLAQGRTKETKDVLEKAAETNNIHLEHGVLDNILYVQEEDKRISFCELLNVTLMSKKLLLRFFLSIMWFAASTFIVYGYRIGSMTLPGNKYLNFALMTSMAILASCLSTFVMIRFRRKTPLVSSFLFCSILCFIPLLIPKGITDLSWLSIILHMMGYFTSSIFFATTYVYVSEIFPTFSRNSMHSLCSSLGRVGAISATQIPLLLVYWEGLPSLILGLVALLAGVATLLAPDAADDVLPDTVEQAEQLDKQPARNNNTSTRYRNSVEATSV